MVLQTTAGFYQQEISATASEPVFIEQSSYDLQNIFFFAEINHDSYITTYQLLI